MPRRGRRHARADRVNNSMASRPARAAGGVRGLDPSAERAFVGELQCVRGRRPLLAGRTCFTSRAATPSTLAASTSLSISPSRNRGGEELDGDALAGYPVFGLPPRAERAVSELAERCAVARCRRRRSGAPSRGPVRPLLADRDTRTAGLAERRVVNSEHDGAPCCARCQPVAGSPTRPRRCGRAVASGAVGLRAGSTGASRLMCGTRAKSAIPFF